METLTTTSPAPVNLETEAYETSAEAPHVFNPRDVFELEMIEELRMEQTVSYEDYMSDSTVDEEQRTRNANAAVNRTIDTYLRAHGLAADDDRYAIYKSALSNLSVTAIPESKWYATFAEQTDEDEQPVLGQSGRDKTRAMYQALTGKSYFDVIVSDEEESTETESTQTTSEATHVLIDGEKIYGSLEVHRNKLNALRNSLAELSSKRQSRLGVFERNKQYNEILAKYNEQVVLLGKLEHHALIENEEASETEKKTTVIAFLFDEQKKLREAALEKIQNTHVSKFVDWMNKGNVAQRIAKGVLLGAGAAGVGFAAGAIAGAAGVVAIGAGAATAATAAARFARGYARSDGKNGRGMQQLEAKHIEIAHNSGYGEDTEVNFVEAIQAYFNKQLEKDTQAEQKKRQRSVIAGVGGIAVGAVLGTALYSAVDSGVFDGVANRNIAPINTHAQTAPVEFDRNPIPQEGESIVPYGGDYDNLYPDNNGDGVYNNADRPSAEAINSVEAEDTEGETIETDPHFDVPYGKGGIWLFENMGLTEQDWNSVANELTQKFPDEFKPMGTDVWIRHSGPLSIEAQEYIKTKFNMP